MSNNPVAMVCNHCGRGAPFDGPYDVTRQCRLCWLYHNDPAYRKGWSDETPVSGSATTLPGFFQQLSNLTASVVGHLANGAKHVSPEVLEERKAICTACPHLTAERRCAKCGCYVDVKASWESERCPDDPPRW